ncbi:hypothetical protein Pcinc_022952 [Petrolisthes cinctipes]|uniref:Reverse transcriptase n=1 Tax=Petrolisthes cinctipes TaxID=88211 RepID=A0AAE1FD73_PETCI|nr:hypothetical protein Pcinc_022952 [Petrolisthes cinctipes]
MKTEEDREILQGDIESLQEWSRNWLMPFNPEKCKTMKIHGAHKQITDNKYHMQGMNGEEISVMRTSQEKDLGVTTDEHLSFEEHIQEKVNKANRIMGMVRRSFEYLDVPMCRTISKSIVRPYLEYAQNVWSPYKKRDIRTIENVLRRPSKMIPGLKHLPEL